MCVTCAQSCPTLWNPIGCSLPGSSVYGIFQARILEWVIISASRGSSWPRDRTCVSYVFNALSHQGSPIAYIRSHQSLSRVRLFATPWITARQASLSNTNSRSSLRLTSIESVMPSSHLILCHPLLLLPPIPPSIRVFSNESSLCNEVAKVLEFQL